MALVVVSNATDEPDPEGIRLIRVRDVEPRALGGPHHVELVRLPVAGQTLLHRLQEFLPALDLALVALLLRLPGQPLELPGGGNVRRGLLVSLRVAVELRPGQINRYNAARDKVDNEEVFYKLKGMANNDLGGFVELDFTDPKFKLSARQIDQLDKLKQKIIQQPFNDPRVERALSQIRGSRGAELEALGIYRRTDRNKDDYDRFTGALQQALDVWQDVNKKPASYKDIVETIAPQVLRKQTEPSFFGLWSSEVPMYNKTIPDEWKDSVRKEIVSMGGQPPSEEVLRRAYMREQFQALYGKPKVKGDREAPSAPVSK